MRILAAAGDAGGARALLPVIRALGGKVACRAYAAAAEEWKAAGLSPSPLQGDVLDGFDRVLLGTTVGPVRWEPSLIRKARGKGVRTVSVIDFWDHYRERFLLEGVLELPDAVAVADAAMREEMAACGFPPDRLHVTGQPAFEALERSYPLEGAARARERLAGLAGGGPFDRITMFVCQPLSGFYRREELGYLEDDVLKDVVDALRKIHARRPGGLLLIKRHPKDAGDAPEVPPSPGLRTAVAVHGTMDPREMVLGADLVVGMSSTLLLEAALLGRPVISHQPGLKSRDVLPSNRLGWTRGVYHREDLSAAVDELLFSKAVPRRPEGWGAGATARVTDLLMGKDRRAA